MVVAQARKPPGLFRFEARGLLFQTKAPIIQNPIK